MNSNEFILPDKNQETIYMRFDNNIIFVVTLKNK
jgi:hypothetical protein